MVPTRLRRSALLGILLAAFILLPAPIQGQEKPRSPKRGESYAFLVGVGDYDSKELRPLKYPPNDIRAFHQTLLDSGFKKDNIVLMHDSAPRRYLPEVKKIREELRLLLARLDRDDTLVVALAGHGVQFKGEKAAFFCPVDAGLTDRATLIALDKLYQQLAECKAGRKLLLVDACRNDPQSRLSRSRAEVDLEKLTKLQRVAVPKGIVALFSCSPGEESFEAPELEHGVFFYHVLQGWQGKADPDGEGSVTLDDLVSYVKKQTRKYVHLKLRAIQTPEVKGEYGVWILKKIDLAILALQAGKAILEEKERTGNLDKKAFHAGVIGYRRCLYNQRTGRAEDGAIKQAIAKFSEVIRLRPGNAAAYYERAKAYRFIREYELAVADFSDAVRMDPSFAEALLERGQIHYRNEKRKKAFADYQEVVHLLQPKNAQKYLLRGQAYLGQAFNGQEYIDKAIKDFTEAIRLNPKSEKGFLLRSRAYYQSGSKGYAKAFENITEAIRFNPKSVEGYLLRAFIYFQNREDKKAIADCNKALQLAPNDPFPYSLRGDFYSFFRNKDRAIADYTKVIKIEPTDHSAYQRRAVFYFLQDDYERAISDFTEAIHLKPKNPLYYRDRADVYLQKGDQARYRADFATYKRLINNPFRN